MKIRTTLSAMLFGFVGSTAFAGSFGCHAYNVTIPCVEKGWHFSAEGHYLQHGNDDLEFYRLENPSNFYRSNGVDPDYHFGWRVEGGWHFGKGNDITFNWMHFDKHESRAVGNSSGQLHDSNARFKAHIFNVEFGQLYTVGQEHTLRGHAGFQVFRLDHNFINYVFASNGNLNDGHKSISEFHGFGIRTGLDWIWDLTNGFQLVTRGAGSLLAGNIDRGIMRKQGQQNWDPYVGTIKTHQVVPSLEGRLSLRYLRNFEKGVLSLDAGWGFLGLFQSVHHVYRSSSMSRPTQNVSNYFNHGPVVTISYAQRN